MWQLLNRRRYEIGLKPLCTGVSGVLPWFTRVITYGTYVVFVLDSSISYSPRILQHSARFPMMLSQVEAMRDQMRPSERKLADYVIEAPREVLDLSMTEVAARAGVSQPTIARFCHALGFSGFREFKIRLAQGIATEVPAVYRDVRPDEPTPGVAAKVLDRTIGALIQVRNNLSTDSVAAAIQLLAQAKRIEFYGAGGAYVFDVGGIAGRRRCRRRDFEYGPHARHHRRREIRDRRGRESDCRDAWEFAAGSDRVDRTVRECR